MRRWFSAAAASAGNVAERPELWLPGALAWVASVGWIPLLLAVARSPSDAELTFLGARIVTSGAWPWNAIVGAAALALVVLVAFAVVALANAAVLAMVDGRHRSPVLARRLFLMSLLAAVPSAFVMLLLALVAVAIAPGAFNAPAADGSAPVRMLGRLAPILLGLLATVVAGGAFVAATTRAERLRDGPRTMLRIGVAGWTHALVAAVVQVAYLCLATLLLGVLWAPIGAEAGGGRIGITTGLLLVGFVAIWLCLVLAGGALHAWSATTWSRLLATGTRSIDSRRT